ncbi:hypothetical protein O6H91_21G014600 [Diphasiastrum complanatum]|uniref:Uncharacterized protein n=1 Tax=Diphasiastrum complanatum TaxID=34168 RepID=A0ACC2AI37_DIPCM|nr:hypothetical protein O6H91_21G014600 [Diphasiastrum complanatum]
MVPTAHYPVHQRVPLGLILSVHIFDVPLQQCAHFKNRGQPQRTLSGPVTRMGKGLHSGEESTLTLFPATAGEGRYFVYMNDIVTEKISASADNVVETRLSTCLGIGHTKVRTVEHLMSALEGIGVNNCRIELRGGQEVPLLDGSASQWVKAVEEVGLSIAQDRHGCQLPALSLKVHKPIFVFDGDSFVAAFPAPATRVTCGIDFPQQAIGRQWFTWYHCNNASYKSEIAAARTFGIYEQIEQLQQAGLIKGASLDNALVCSESGWLNPPLRFPDEPCRHKLLDLVGDLALCAQSGHLGLPVAHIISFKASHSLHVKFCKAILQAAKDH